jgi:hypothetical protein
MGFSATERGFLAGPTKPGAVTLSVESAAALRRRSAAQRIIGAETMMRTKIHTITTKAVLLLSPVVDGMLLVASRTLAGCGQGMPVPPGVHTRTGRPIEGTPLAERRKSRYCPSNKVGEGGTWTVTESAWEAAAALAAKGRIT